MTSPKCAQVNFATVQNNAEFGRKLSLNDKTFLLHVHLLTITKFLLKIGLKNLNFKMK